MVWSKFVVPVMLAAVFGMLGFLWQDRDSLGNRLTAVEVQRTELTREMHEIHEDVRELRRVLIDQK